VRKRRKDWPQRHRDAEIGARNEPAREDNAETRRPLRFAEKRDFTTEVTESTEKSG
jgi:hypothetical protein